MFNFLKRPKDSPPPTTPDPEKPLILVVDDEQYLNDLYVEILQTEGYGVLSAFNGQEALTLIEKTIPSLILLDIMMPKMDGNEVMAVLQEKEETKRIPVIVLTNNANMENMANAKLYNAYKYVIKSNVDPSEIIQEVKQALAPKSVFLPERPEGFEG